MHLSQLSMHMKKCKSNKEGTGEAFGSDSFWGRKKHAKSQYVEEAKELKEEYAKENAKWKASSGGKRYAAEVLAWKDAKDIDY